jgi:glucokinase
MKNDPIVIGADIGGTHITAAEVSKGEELKSPSSANATFRASVPATASAGELLRAWATCINEVIAGRPVRKICIAMPGPFDYEEGVCLIKNQNKYPGLYGVNVKQQLGTLLQLPSSVIHLHNDAACFVQGEATYGVARGYKTVLGVTLGTGLGTAVSTTIKSWSADLWNMPFKDGIAEDYISSRWFVQRYHTLTGEQIKGVKDLVESVQSNLSVRQIFNEFGNNLALFLKMFIDRVPAEAIVLGGNISKAFSLFSAALDTQLQPFYPSVVILQSDHAERAALTGAVASWSGSDNRIFTS